MKLTLYKKNILYLKNLNYISQNINTNDSCFIKKNAPKISAVIVGINYKNTDYSLTGAVNDANNMEEFLLSYSHWAEHLLLRSYSYC